MPKSFGNPHVSVPQPPASTETSSLQSTEANNTDTNGASNNSTGSDRPSRIAVAVAVPLAVFSVPLTVVAIAALVVSRDAKNRRSREKKEKMMEKEASFNSDVESDARPYVQPKVELATADQTRHQLHADRIDRELQGHTARHELGGDALQAEMSTNKDQGRMAAPLGQELAGSEPSELDSSEKRTG